MKLVVNSLPKAGTHLLSKLIKNLGFQEYKPQLSGELIRQTHRNPFKNLQKRRRKPKKNESGLWIDLDIKNNRVSPAWLQKCLDKIPEESRANISIHELLREIGLRLEDEDSILYNASRCCVPIFSPGLLDSMLGIPLWMYSRRRRLKIDPLKDFDLFSDIVYDAKRVGAIILGGGTPKHHALYMNTLRDGVDSAVQISSARADDGSLSGAPLREAISWGKVKGDVISTIFGDVTIVFPLVVAAALEKIQK